MDMVGSDNTSLTQDVHAQREQSIGKLLLDMGKISPEGAERVLKRQKEKSIKFGEAAKELGLVSEEDINQALAFQFDYPYLQNDLGQFSSALVAAYQPFSKRVEALRALRTQLILRWFDNGKKSIVIASANSSEGSSELAANLAVVFSQLGEQTLLIDANLRDPVQHKIFNLKAQRGLADILAGRANFEVSTKIPSFVDLTVLTAGTIPPNPQELLNKELFKDLLKFASKNYDVIIVDTSPVRESSDAQIVSKQTGGALLVSKLNETRVSEVTDATNQLKSFGVEVVGVVVNEF